MSTTSSNIHWTFLYQHWLCSATRVFFPPPKKKFPDREEREEKKPVLASVALIRPSTMNYRWRGEACRESSVHVRRPLAVNRFFSGSPIAKTNLQNTLFMFKCHLKVEWYKKRERNNKKREDKGERGGETGETTTKCCWQVFHLLCRGPVQGSTPTSSRSV